MSDDRAGGPAPDPGPGPARLLQVDVDNADGWRPVPMAESSGPVQLRLLRRFGPESMSVLVRFPAGWSRPPTGYYAAPELFVVLDGVVKLGHRSFVAGTGGYLPAYVTRERTQSPTGALAWAHFDGLAEFVRSEGGADSHLREGPIVQFSLARRDERAGGLDHGATPAAPATPEHLVARHPDGWTTWVLGNLGSAEVGPAELLSPAGRWWAYADDGAALPPAPGPLVVRRPGGAPSR